MKKQKKKKPMKKKQLAVQHELTSASKDDFYRKILVMQEEEKRRIARDLHDEVGQIVIALGASFNIMEKILQGGNIEKALELIENDRTQVQDIAKRMKTMALNLRPPALDILGLSDVLREYFSHCTTANPMRIEFNENIKDTKFEDNVEITLYRIVQEAMYNIQKHSGASEVKVNLYAHDGRLQLDIEDNGKGFDVSKYRQNHNPATMGLRGIRERVGMLNGKCAITSVPGKGTKLSVTLTTKEVRHGDRGNAGR